MATPMEVRPTPPDAPADDLEFHPTSVKELLRWRYLEALRGFPGGLSPELRTAETVDQYHCVTGQSIYVLDPLNYTSFLGVDFEPFNTALRAIAEFQWKGITLPEDIPCKPTPGSVALVFFLLDWLVRDKVTDVEPNIRLKFLADTDKVSVHSKRSGETTDVTWESWLYARIKTHRGPKLLNPKSVPRHARWVAHYARMIINEDRSFDVGERVLSGDELQRAKREACSSLARTYRPRTRED